MRLYSNKEGWFRVGSNDCSRMMKDGLDSKHATNTSFHVAYMFFTELCRLVLFWLMGILQILLNMQDSILEGVVLLSAYSGIAEGG